MFYSVLVEHVANLVLGHAAERSHSRLKFVILTCVVERSSFAFRDALIFKKQPGRRETQLDSLFGRAGRPFCGVWEVPTTGEIVNTALVSAPKYSHL